MVKEVAGGLPDSDLVRLAKEGDRKALDELCARHIASVYRVCRGVLGDDEETFLEAPLSLNAYPKPG